MVVTINERFFNALDTFLAEKSCNDVNRDTYLVHNIEDTINKITVSIVFLREWHTDINDDEYGQIVIPNVGAVITVPGYWISIPKELAFTYLREIVNQFYNDHVSEWKAAEVTQQLNHAGNNGSNTGTSYGNVTVAPCQCPAKFIGNNI